MHSLHSNVYGFHGAAVVKPGKNDEPDSTKQTRPRNGGGGPRRQTPRHG